MDWYQLVDTTNAPLWLISLLTLFAVGIPFFVLFILGLKMLINNLKSIGTPAKIALFVVWICAIVGLTIFGIRQATETAFEGEFQTEKVIDVRSGDTLTIQMVSNEHYEYNSRRRGRLDIEYNENDEKIIYSSDIRLIVRSTNDSLGRVLVEKRAEGSGYDSAKSRAQAIDYEYTFDGSTLGLNAYLTTAIENKYRDQEVEVIVYLPIGTVLYADDNTYSFHRNDSYYRDILDNGDEEHYLLIEDGQTRCLDCPGRESTFEPQDDKVIYKRNEDGNFERISAEDEAWLRGENNVEVVIDSVQTNATEVIDTIINNNN